MKNLFIPIFTFLLLIACNSQVPEKIDSTSNQSLLWEISGNGLETPSYLFGTMHLVPKDDFFMPAGTKKALESTDLLVMEIDVDIPLKKQIEIAQRGLIPENGTLADYMSEEEYNNVVKFLTDSIGISDKKLEKYIRFKPFILTGIIMTEALGKVETYEKYFADVAKKQKKNFTALESIEFQLALFDTIPIEDQIEGAFHSDMMDEYYLMLECYKAQNLDCLHQMITEYDDEEFEQLFLKQRNHNWAEKLKNSILPTHSAFIAVGAGHLPGAEGLIALLRQKGYTVEPVIE